MDKVGDHKTHDIPPRKAVTALPTPPSVDRTTKPPISPTKENAEDQAAAAGGYEPIGKSLQPKKTLIILLSTIIVRLQVNVHLFTELFYVVEQFSVTK